MNGGPFRDTLTPLIEEAQRQLAELRQRRAALEARHEEARKRLDAKTDLVPDASVAVFEALRESEEGEAQPIVWPRPGALKTPFLVGAIVGLLTWFQIAGPHR
jgi:hypothetical protein